MNWQHINEFFAQDRMINVPKEAVACYVVAKLSVQDRTYAQEIQADIGKVNQNFQISTTALGEALKFLQARELITYTTPSRSGVTGTPRRYFKLRTTHPAEISSLSALWKQYLGNPY